jgi:hypothetical protein
MAYVSRCVMLRICLAEQCKDWIITLVFFFFKLTSKVKSKNGITVKIASQPQHSHNESKGIPGMRLCCHPLIHATNL